MATIILTESSRANLATSLDKVGLRKGLVRYEGESLEAFRLRLLDIWEHRSSTSHSGLQAGVARQLGDYVQTVARIKVKRNADETTVGAAPAIRVDENYITFYSDFANEVEEQRFNRTSEFPRGKETHAFYLKEIFDWLATSVNFELDKATADADQWIRATHLTLGSSFRTLNTQIRIKAGHSRLPHQNLVPGSFQSFSSMLSNEVADTSLIVSEGDYHVSYLNGVIWSYGSVEQPSAFISYSYIVDPWELQVSSLKASSLADQTYYSLLRHVRIDDDNLLYEEKELSYDLVHLIIGSYREDGTYWFSEDVNDTPVDINGTYIASDVVTDAQDRFYLSDSTIREVLKRGRR